MPRLFKLVKLPTPPLPPTPAREVELLGGPCDGRKVNVPGGTTAIRMPVPTSMQKPISFLSECAEKPSSTAPSFAVVEYEQVEGLDPNVWHLVRDGVSRRARLSPVDHSHFEKVPTLWGWGVVAAGTALSLAMGSVLLSAVEWLLRR
jgi:hypothetical protein